MSFFVEVVTRDLSDLEKPAEIRIINHELHNARVWLGRHCYWAIRNNHSVLTRPIEQPME